MISSVKPFLVTLKIIKRKRQELDTPDPEALEDFPQSDASDPASDTSDTVDFTDEDLQMIFKLDNSDANEANLKLKVLPQLDPPVPDKEDLEPFTEPDPSQPEGKPLELEDFPQSDDALDPASDTSDISDFSDEALTLILKLDPPDPNEEKLRLEDFLQTDLDEEDLEPFPQQDPLDLNVEALVQARELLAHRDPSSPSEEALELEQVHHPDLPYPDEEAFVFGFSQTSWHRRQILGSHKAAYFNYISLLVAVSNCLCLTFLNSCTTQNRSILLQSMDHVCFAFFMVEMVMKILAHGAYGRKGYLRNNWSKLDGFILLCEFVGYFLRIFNVNFALVLDSVRPLRLLRRIPSQQRYVEIIIRTLPMFGRVIFTFAVIIFIFSVMAVKLWKGQLHNRCFLSAEAESIFQLNNMTMALFYDNPTKMPFLCSTNDTNGQQCSVLPSTVKPNMMCPGPLFTANWNDSFCLDLNTFYTECQRAPQAPYRGAVNFDDVPHAFITMFQVTTLEGWSEVMIHLSYSSIVLNKSLEVEIRPFTPTLFGQPSLPSSTWIRLCGSTLFFGLKKFYSSVCVKRREEKSGL
ncbi:hypothetical protein WMY93_031795 [Mugilogobius chulae]|uniref:Ion transport domain-containing protein n=1 Tax=Mugilogobius chulae TaxID=88201 RepID=A0AAW0MDX7_9GOBI